MVASLLGKCGVVVKPLFRWWTSRRKISSGLFPVEEIPLHVQEKLSGPWTGRVRMTVPVDGWPDEMGVTYYLEAQPSRITGKCYFPGADKSQRTSELLGGLQNGHVVRLDYKLISPKLTDFGYGEVMLHLPETKDHLIGFAQGYVSGSVRVYSAQVVLCKGTASPCTSKHCPYLLGGDPLALTVGLLPGILLHSARKPAPSPAQTGSVVSSVVGPAT